MRHCALPLLLLNSAQAQSAAAIPDPASFFEQVKAHQHDMDAVRENYTFHRLRREDEVDAKGNIVHSSSQEREVFFVNGFQIARLVKKDGVELSAAEDKAEQARVRKLVETRMKSPPRKPGLSGRVSLISSILAVSTISKPRRVSLHGRDTLAFDFIGDRKAGAHNRNERVARKMAGTVWLDEADRHLARLEVNFFDNYRIGGGLLASIGKGTALTVEQSPVSPGLWMQTSSEEHLDARLVVKRYREQVHVTNFAFKKFEVEASEQISPQSR